MPEDLPPPIPPAATLALCRTVSGPVLHPTDPAFPPGLRAAVAVVPADEAEAESAVRVVADHGLVLGSQVRVLVDRLTDVRIDAVARIADVGAGTTWRTLAVAAAQQGLAPVPSYDGEEPVVAAARTGGLGPLAGSHGWAADRLRELRHARAGGLSVVTGAVLDLVAAPRLDVAVHDGWRADGSLTTVEPDGTVRTLTVTVDEHGLELTELLDRHRGPRSEAPGLLLARFDDEVLGALATAAERIRVPIALQPVVPGFAERAPDAP